MNDAKRLLGWAFDGVVILAGFAYAATADLSLGNMTDMTASSYASAAEPGAMILAGISLFVLRALILTQNSREYA